MTNKTRRHLLAKSFGIVSSFSAGSVVAKVCGSSTPQQPLGPFYPNDGTPRVDNRELADGPVAFANDNDLTWVKNLNGESIGHAKGQVVLIKGVLRDKNCKPLKGAMIVIWQASSTGSYNHRGDQNNEKFRHPKTGKVITRELDPSFQYWGKTITNEKGEYFFKTVVPGFYPANLDQGWFRPPHIHFLVSAIGHKQFVTQSYFTGDVLNDSTLIDGLNAKDFLLHDREISDEHRKILIVEFKKDKSKNPIGIFNIDLPT